MSARYNVRGRACNVCGLPMLAGQRERHGVCSPPLPCCGYPEDLAGDLMKHREAHAELEAERAAKRLGVAS